MIRDTSAQDKAIDTRPARSRRLVQAIVAATLLLALALVAWPAYDRWAGSEISVAFERLRIATVERGTFTREIGVTGRVVAAIAPTLYASALGTVTLQVQAGDRVEEGQELASIHSPEVLNELERARAGLESITVAWQRQQIEARAAELRNQQTVDLARVRLEAARRETERARRAFEQGVMSHRDAERIRDELATAEVEHKHAVEDAELDKESLAFDLTTRKLEVDQQQLLVDNLQRRADELVIRSPVTGMVGNVLIDQRATVSANTPILSVVDLTALEVETEIPESHADSLLIGVPAEITYGNTTYPGMIAAVSPEVRNAQVATRVRFANEAPSDLRQNQRVSIRVVLETRDDTLTVQRGPFLESGSGRMAYRIGDGVARRVSIRTGSASVNQVEILDGLEAGDRIVISSTGAFENADTVYLRNY